MSPHPRDEDEPHGIAARPQRWLPLQVGVAVAALAVAVSAVVTVTLAVLGRRAEGVMTQFRARDHVVVAGRPGSERSLRSAHVERATARKRCPEPPSGRWRRSATAASEWST